MSGFICPLCGLSLTVVESKTLRCSSNHSFDIARQGYVNLLMSQQASSKHHGDDKLMVKSRSAFLNKGFYTHLAEKLTEVVLAYAKPACVVLDAGCGECYYTDRIEKALAIAGLHPSVLGVDISKDALIEGAKRNKNLQLAVGSVFAVPIADGCCDIVINVFAPMAPAEYQRVLKPGGILVKVYPLARHLWELKVALYDQPYENPEEGEVPEGFVQIQKEEIRKNILLSSHEEIQNLFKMTPYYYKTGVADQAKLDTLSTLQTETAFGIGVYERS